MTEFPPLDDDELPDTLGLLNGSNLYGSSPRRSLIIESWEDSLDEAVNRMDSSAEKYSCDDADDDDDIFVTIFYKNQVCNYTLFLLATFSTF